MWEQNLILYSSPRVVYPPPLALFKWSWNPLGMAHYPNTVLICSFLWKPFSSRYRCPDGPSLSLGAIYGTVGNAYTASLSSHSPFFLSPSWNLTLSIQILPFPASPLPSKKSLVQGHPFHFNTFYPKHTCQFLVVLHLAIEDGEWNMNELTIETDTHHAAPDQ